MGISEKTMKQLEDLQLMFLRVVFSCPASTPKCAMLWDSHMVPIRYKIMYKKLTFINAIKHQDSNNIAREVLEEQMRQKWPGLASEAVEMCTHLNIPDITVVSIAVPQWKRTVKSAIQVKVEEVLRDELRNLKKVSDLASEKFERKPYLSNKNIHEARTTFLLRAGMWRCKWNYSSDPKFSRDLWRCDQPGCGMVDTTSHVLYCSAFKKLREGLNIADSDDVVSYYTQVMKIREESRNVTE